MGESWRPPIHPTGERYADKLNLTCLASGVRRRFGQVLFPEHAPSGATASPRESLKSA